MNLDIFLLELTEFPYGWNVEYKKKKEVKGISRQISGYDSLLPPQEAQFPSLLRELRSHMLYGTAKEKRKKEIISFKNNILMKNFIKKFF